MPENKPLSFDDDDFAPSPQPRKGSSTVFWVVLGCGFVGLVVVTIFLLSTTRRLTEMRMMEAQVAESQARDAESRAILEVQQPVRKKMDDVPMGPLIDEMRSMMPQRLMDARLVPIKKGADWFWSFNNGKFVLQAGKEPLPDDLANALLGLGRPASSIEGSWRLEDDNRLLILEEMRCDGKKIDREVKLKLEPAGPRRVNLGTFLYTIVPGMP